MTKIKLVFKYAFRDIIKQRVRSILGLFGLIMSVGLLAIVLFLSDTISVAFVDYLSVDAGNQDIVVTIYHSNGEPVNRSDYFEFQPVIQTIEGVSDDIDKYIPRMEVTGKVNMSGTEYVKTATISGINISLENEYGFGTFTVPEENVLLGLNSLPMNHCAIYYGFNKDIDYEIDDSIEVVMSMTHGNQTLERTVNLTVDYIFDFNLKWPAEYRSDNLIVVDINTTYTIFGYDEFKGKCKKLILTFKPGLNYYDARNLQGSEMLVKASASRIQLALGINLYDLELPKLEILGYSEFLGMALTIIFVFVAIIAMLISGILISGILKTSVEERIREFGIFRTLGAYKSYNLSIVLVQGISLCGIGSAIGIGLAYVATEYILIPVVISIVSGDIALGISTVVFAPQLISFIIPLAMGLSIGLIVSISPALKVMKLQLIESIHPYRHEDTLYHLQKKATVNYKLILLGLILALNGGFIYFVIPRLLVSLDLTLMAGVLIAILMIFLIGLTLAGLGLMPLILRIVIQLFRPASRRLHHIIKIFVFRYQRRNSSTVIMFAMSFSFVLFTTTVINDLVAQVGTMTRLGIGSDLQINTEGWVDTSGGLFGGGFGGGLFGGDDDEPIDPVDPNRIMTTEFEQDLLRISGVERVSSVLASPEHLTQIYSSSDKEFSAEIGDYAGMSTLDITLLGIDGEYSSTVDDTYMIFTAGNRETAFMNIEELDNTCIISEAIAINLQLSYGEQVRIVIHRGDELEVYEFTIVGIASSMPGFSGRFGSSSMGANMGGVMVSHETYLDIIDIPTPTYIDRIFIKIQDSALSTSRKIVADIEDVFENEYDYRVRNLLVAIANQESLFSMINNLFFLILLSTIFISLFGLLASSYSTIIERKKEIGIVRTLGLKGKDVNHLFIIEALIIMLSSGTVGTIIGYATGWLLSSNMNMMTDIPSISVFPWTQVITIYALSAMFIYFGMRLLLRKARKKKIVDIYRETM